MDKKKYGYWTESRCLDESKKYTTVGQFSKNSNGAYNAAKRNGWLKSYTWLSPGIQIKWTKEKCYEEAKKYKTKNEFQKRSHSAYSKARKNNWIKDYTWLEDRRFDLYVDKIDSIYVYEFKEQNAAYVGRTLMRNQKQRDWEHIFRNDSVSSFAKLNNISVPEMKILEDNLTLREGVEREEFWIEEYKSTGWFMINKAKAGSIGSLGNGKWTYESCKEEAKKYTSIREFSKKSSGAYGAARRNNWLTDYTWFVMRDKKKDTNIKTKNVDINWTYDTCYEEAKKYKLESEFCKQSKNAYGIAKEQNWLSNYTWLVRDNSEGSCIYVYEFKDQNAFYINVTLTRRIKNCEKENTSEKSIVFKFAKKNSVPIPEIKVIETGLTVNESSENKNIWIELYEDDGWIMINKKDKSYYTAEICSKLSKRCKSRTDFREKYQQAYKISIKNKWINDYTWLKKERKNRKQKYDYQTCYNEAKKYKSIADFERGNKGACRAARSKGWLKDYTWFISLWQIKWNEETCYEEAKKYNTLSEFIEKSTSCYNTACKNNWIDNYTWLLRKQVKPGYWQNYDNCYNEAKKYKTQIDFIEKSNGAYKSAYKNGWIKDYTWLKTRTN